MENVKLYQYKDLVKVSSFVYNGTLATRLNTNENFNVLSPVNTGTNYEEVSDEVIIQDTLSNKSSESLNFSISFKVHSDIIGSGTKFILHVPGLLNVKAQDNTLAFMFEYSDSGWIYSPTSNIITGWNNLSLDGNGTKITLTINAKEYTLLDTTNTYLEKNLNCPTDNNHWIFTNKVFNPGNNTWEAVTKIHTPNEIPSSKSWAFMGAYPFIIYRDRTTNKLQYYLSSSTSSFNIANAITADGLVFEPNKDYWLKLEFTGTQYIYSYKLDKNSQWTSLAPVDSSSTVAEGCLLNLGSWNNYQGTGSTQSSAYFGNGLIDLNQTYVKINGETWFDGTQASKKLDWYWGFSSSNYLTMPMSYASNNCEHIWNFRTMGSSTSFSGNVQIVRVSGVYELYFRGGNKQDLYMYNISSSTSTKLFTLDLNTVYWIKVIITPTGKSFACSTDGTTFGEPVVVEDTAYNPTGNSIYIGNWEDGDRAYKSTILIGGSTLYNNGELVFDGSTAIEGNDYTVVGTPTRGNGVICMYGQLFNITDNTVGPIYPQITIGELNTSQSWLYLKDIDAEALLDSDLFLHLNFEDSTLSDVSDYGGNFSKKFIPTNESSLVEMTNANSTVTVGGTGESGKGLIDMKDLEQFPIQNLTLTNPKYKDLTDEFAIEFWGTKPTGISGKLYGAAAYVGENQVANFSLLYIMNTIQSTINTEGTQVRADINNALITGWNHFIIDFKSAQYMKLYVNDTLVYTVNNVDSISSGIDKFVLTFSNDQTNPVDPLLDEFKVYNHLLKN